MQLLVLKILYLLFTTKGTSEYFYTNDLCVLVDVFLRELGDLDEESESVSLRSFPRLQTNSSWTHLTHLQLRHTYLRVLHPLLTKTQLRQVPYKRPQIVRTLESLVEHPEIRDVSATTRRLVERCLSGEWCVQLRKGAAGKLAIADLDRTSSPSNDQVAKQEYLAPPTFERHGSLKKSNKSSRSVENLRTLVPASGGGGVVHKGLEALRRPNNDSVLSLPGVVVATSTSSKRRDRINSTDLGQRANNNRYEERQREKDGPISPIRANSLGTGVDGIVSPYHQHPSAFPLSSTTTTASPPLSPASVMSSQSVLSTMSANAIAPPGTVNATAQKPPQRRSAPAPPPKRRKPPAVPVTLGQTNGGATITTIKSSTSTPMLTSLQKFART